MKNGCTKKAALLLAAAAGLTCSTAAFAQGSDSCASATPVTDGAFFYDLTGATNEGNTGAACGGTAAAEDVWLAYTATVDGTLTASTCGGASDTVLSFFSDCSTQIVCLDDFCGLQTEISTFMTTGQTVLIRIADYAGGTHAGTINITGPGAPPPPPPPGDNCADAIPAVDGANAFNNINANTDGPDECLAFGQSQINQDVWYTYTATADGDLKVQTCGGAAFDTKIALYDATAGCPTFASSLACNDDFCGLQSQIAYPVTTGQQFIIRIGAFGIASGAGTFNISIAPPCEITQPGGATVETELCGEDLNGGCNSAPEAFDSVACGSSTIYGQAWSDANFRDTDWYKITTYSDATITASLTGDFPAACFILSGGCAGLVAEAIGTTTDGCENTTISAFLPAGTYYVFAGTNNFAGYPCSSGNNEYVLDISTDGGCVPTGACCMTTSCAVMTADACSIAGGSYLGDDTICENPGNYALVSSSNTFDDISVLPEAIEILQGDDTFVNVPVGFNFNFYGNTYADCYVESNGYVSFGNGNGVYVNGALPSAGAPNNAAYALWDDFNFAADPGAKCYHATLGTAGVDLRFVAQWTNVPQFAAAAGTSFNTFQAILWENGTVEYRYGAVDGFVAGDATIGIENADGTAAVSADGADIGTGGVAYSATYTPGSSNCTGGGCAWEVPGGCPSDQDGDGDIDSDDINLFFAEFENGGSCGDHDGDEDVDSDDITLFFAAFENGAC